MAPFGTPVEDVFHDVRILLAAAEDASIRLEGPWVRRAPVVPNTPSSAAGYVTIVNQGGTPDVLLSAAADLAASVEIHETRNMSGMMMMERIPKIALPPGGRVELKPGGYHLMLMGLKRALSPGQSVTLTLVCERAGPVTIRAEVR
jgi:copper(I)-binding protein